MFQVIEGGAGAHRAAGRGAERRGSAITAPPRQARHDTTRAAPLLPGRIAIQARPRGTRSRRWLGDLRAAVPPGSRILSALDLFLLERGGRDLSRNTMEYYELHLGEFVAWLAMEHPEIGTMEDIAKEHVSAYRVYLKTRPPRRSCARGETLSKEALQGSQRAVRTFFGWAQEDGYAIDARILNMPKTKLPDREADVYHLTQIRTLLDTCDTETERLILRFLVGSGARISEAAGVSLRADDGLADLMIDSLDRGYADLRLRWNAGTKGLKTRRVPVCPRLVAAIRRYESRSRRDSAAPELFISDRTGRPMRKPGLDTLMDRLQRRAGFRVHAHAFRHTFATVAVQMGWNLERLRAAMGHENYDTLLRYVRLASVRDLGDLQEWTEYVATPPGRVAPTLRG